MWILTQHGAYSVVAYDPERDLADGPNHPTGTHLLVRGRADRDIEALRRWIPDLEVNEDRTADYRYRSVLSRTDWVRAMASEAAVIDYTTDFKGRVGEVLGSDREGLYTQVWGILRGIREDE